jgi:hypothetical protein
LEVHLTFLVKGKDAICFFGMKKIIMYTI